MRAGHVGGRRHHARRGHDVRRATTRSGRVAASATRRHGRVLVADPGREFAFVTDEGGRESTVWRYRFEPVGDGRTRVTEGYEVRWIPTWARILDVPLNRHKELLAGMRTTLERLRSRPSPAAAAPARRP